MKSRQLLAAVHRLEDFPAPSAPVVAFAGRSNVGKSSLLNRLIGLDAARVSKTPGRTQGIYLYESGEGWIAADLPGFGFAKASRADRQVWAALASGFFETRPPALTAALIDPRIGPSDLDLDFRDYLRDLGLPSVSIATKADQLKAVERARATRALEKDFGPLLWISTRTGEGIEELKKTIRRRVVDRNSR